MRSPGVVVGLALAVLALAACGDDGGEDQAEPTPTGPAPSGPAGTGAGVAECAVGDWRSTGVSGEVASDAAAASVSGGSDVALAIGADGATTVDFAAMAPVAFDGQVAGTDFAGELSYDGAASGTIRTDPGATSGSWEPVGAADWSAVTVTVELIEPAPGRPIDEAPISDVVGQANEVTGDVVDVEPILGEGTFQCEGDTLVLSPSDGESGLTWTLARA